MQSYLRHNLSVGDNNFTCSKCKQDVVYFPDEVFWDEHGFGYSTKLVKCPNCSQVNILGHIEDRGLAKLNINDWEYETSYSNR